MRFFISFFLFFICFIAYSQECDLQKRKQKKIFKKIERSIEDNNFYEALDIIAKQKNEPIFQVLKAEIYFLRGDYYKAEKISLSLIDICPNLPKPYYFLGYILFQFKDYEKAINYLEISLNLGISEKYKESSNVLIEKSRTLLDIINNPFDFDPKLVLDVSSKYDEYLPMLSPDQSLFFFTRRLDKSTFSSITQNTVEEFTLSFRDGMSYTYGHPLSYPFNIDYNEGGSSITIDNRILYFTKCRREKSNYNNCDIFYVNFIDSNWSEIYSFSEKISGKKTWESQPTVSPDGNTIIFSSDRGGGYGETDLYEIKLNNGEWSDPVNLGSRINSVKSEKSPFLHTDGKTLFFASDYFPSLGGYDIFFSKKDSIGEWSDPKNIGFPINTEDDEFSFIVSTDGSKGYFASNSIIDSLGGWNIYSFDLDEEIRPERVLFLNGEVVGENGMIVDDLNIEIKNLETNEVEVVKVNKGKYVASLTLSKDDNVLITIKKTGYNFSSKFISSKDSIFNSPSSLNFDLQKLEKNKSFIIDNIYFDNNSYEIKDLSGSVLLEFAEYLHVNSNLKIEIQGFTDNSGSSIDNQLLSEKRAKSVRKYLIELGVNKTRIISVGYGEENPKYSNDSEIGRAKNRRTELKVLSY